MGGPQHGGNVGQVEIGETEPRKTRMTWSRLDYLNPNPDRGIYSPIATSINRDVNAYPPRLSGGRSAHAMRYLVIESGCKDESETEIMLFRTISEKFQIAYRARAPR